MEVIEKVEQREDFKEWAEVTYALARYTWLEMPETAKMAIIQEWLREEKRVRLEIYYDEDNTLHVWKYRFTCASHYSIATTSTYIEALAKGIGEALKLIDNRD